MPKGRLKFFRHKEGQEDKTCQGRQLAGGKKRQLAADCQAKKKKTCSAGGDDNNNNNDARGHIWDSPDPVQQNTM